METPIVFSEINWNSSVTTRPNLSAAPESADVGKSRRDSATHHDSGTDYSDSDYNSDDEDEDEEDDDKLTQDERVTLMAATQKVEHAQHMFKVQKNALLRKRWADNLAKADATLSDLRQHLGLEEKNAKRKRSGSEILREDVIEKKGKVEMSEARAFEIAKQSLFSVFRGAPYEDGGADGPATKFVYESIVKGVDMSEMRRALRG